jgi:flotillin
MAIVLVLAFALALVFGPLAASMTQHALNPLVATLMTVSGLGLVVLSAVLLVITRLYVKTKASEAFVRTGMGGLRVIKDGGSVVVPVIHQIVKISLRTMRLDVGREGPDALITKDKLRADIKAEFFVRVMPDDDSIKSAARSFGEKMDDERYVGRLVEDKLISALRTIAATKTLEDLNSQRDEFVKQVTEIVTPDLAHNGLTLEVATISRLDQTALHNLRDDNVFDAQGKRTIAAITQEQATARNELERAGEQARMQKDVETRQAMLALERQQSEAEAAQQAQIAVIRAEKAREAQEKAIEANRAVEIANVLKQQAVQVAERQQQQAVETAERQKQEAIASAEQARAAAEALLARAEAQREHERQAVKTVQVKAEAERAKLTQVIGAEAEAERRYTEAQRAADAAAYRLQKEAEGKKAAADAEAEAVTKRAQAEASAKRAHAEGDKALQMVPVEVAKEQVGVKQREVEVLQQELEARAQHGAAAQAFEIEKLRITKEAEVRIAGAQAMATFGGKIEATFVGTPEDVSRMTQSYMKGMGVARTLDGFFAGGGGELLDGAAAKIASALGKNGA